MKPLTERMEKVLVAMRENEGEWGLSGNEIAYLTGFRTGSDRSAHDGRSMGPAQRVISSVRGLEERGLVGWASRKGGRSGSAHALTEKGREVADELIRGAKR